MSDDKKIDFDVSEAIYGYMPVPDHHGDPCSCGDIDCEIPKLWKVHYDFWIPVFERMNKESFMDKYGLPVALVCTFILGMIVSSILTAL
jgi:hypothetical protein